MIPAVMPTRVPNLLVNGSLGHRGRHGHQHSAAQPARGDRRACLALIDDPAIEHRRPDGVSSRARISRPAAIINGRAGIVEAYRTGRGRIFVRARAEVDHRRQDRQGHDHHHRDPLPAEQGAADRADRRAGQGKEDRGHHRAARRVRQGRPAGGDRAAPRRVRRGGAEQPLRADPAAERVRHQLRGAGQRPAARAEPEADARGVRPATAAKW